MKRLLGTIISLCLLSPFAALAEDGVVVADISLQAGPDTQYPSITELSAGTPVSIQGCIDGWTWCDVIAGDDRGWIAGTYVEENYDNQQVIVADYGPRIGIPIVAFSLGVYWEAHYRSRPWYGERQSWVARNIRPGPPPRPVGVAAHPVARPAQPVKTGPAPKAPQANTLQPPRTTATEKTTEKTKTVQKTAVETRPTSASEEKQQTTMVHKDTPKPKPVPKAAPKSEPKPPPKKDDDDHKGGDTKDHGNQSRAAA